jgi:uncharacterized membrane protein YcaP (DUF421 family)
VEALAAFVLLAGLQYLVAWLSVRSPRFGDLVKSEPTLLLHRGRFLEAAMRAQRVTRPEILAPPCAATAPPTPPASPPWCRRPRQASA